MRSTEHAVSAHYITLPRAKVVCKGFNPAQNEITRRRQTPRVFPRDVGANQVGCRAEAYSYPTTLRRRISSRSGMDSDLEAFSHYPADGSVAALPGQTAAKTNYLNQRFLSY